MADRSDWLILEIDMGLAVQVTGSSGPMEGLKRWLDDSDAREQYSIASFNDLDVQLQPNTSMCCLFQEAGIFWQGTLISIRSNDCWATRNAGSLRE
ncbi:unnamed protein product [Anisakis simplex]|uniref:CobW C-terminal domain-containing protein n=1 Tax=Anisakis simplex TaxID=6269 RepID=A0A0M3JXV0_ANISI|nr:unnamed protein product [Anisakis simplex]